MCPSVSFCSFHVFCVSGLALVLLPTEKSRAVLSLFWKRKKKLCRISGVSKM